MPIKDTDIIEKASLVLFEEHSIDSLTPKVQDIVKRYLSLHALWLDDPMKPDKDLVLFLMSTFNIEKSQAYRDLANIKSLLGNIRNASKELIRYMVTESYKKVYSLAMEGESPDLFNALSALNGLSKYNKLDQVEDEPMPYNEIVPPSWVPTDDITILDPKLFKPDIEERRNALRRKYGIEQVSDVDFETVSDE
jgi:hypothetical protein